MRAALWNERQYIALPHKVEASSLAEQAIFGKIPGLQRVDQVGGQGLREKHIEAGNGPIIGNNVGQLLFTGQHRMPFLADYQIRFVNNWHDFQPVAIGKGLQCIGVNEHQVGAPRH